jgi:outer membrane protein OmpA-like peptidoglycan-associated protein
LSDSKYNNAEVPENSALNKLRELLVDLIEGDIDIVIDPQSNSSDSIEEDENNNNEEEERGKLKNSLFERSQFSIFESTNFNINGLWENSSWQKPKLLSTSEKIDLTKVHQLIGDLEQKLQKNEDRLDELVGTTNSLIPLLVELLKNKTDLSEATIVSKVVPVVDRIIQQRATQDIQQMAVVFADIIPVAISEEIKRSPEKFARAIAPEIAVAIAEQIKLDRDSISTTLGPEMGKAIKAQIEVERDAMIDALYPVIGSTIAKYMGETIQSINKQVETSLSPQGIRRKIRAKIQGVSEAELILREAVNYEVQAIFLIHKTSGLVMRSLQPNAEKSLDADLLAGMLTAIRSFVNEYIATASEELNEIEYSGSRIILEVAGYCYLAVIVNGEPSQKFLQKIRQILSEIILKHDREIQLYDGDPISISNTINGRLDKLIEPQELERSKSPKALIALTSALLGAILIPWGIIQYRSHVADRIERAVAVQLDATPELSVYRIEPRVRGGKLILTGRLPNYYLRNLAEEVASTIAVGEKIKLQNRIFAVEVPPDPEIAVGEIERLTNLFNQRSGIEINTAYQNKQLTVKGFVSNNAREKDLIQAFEKIPGVETIISKVSDRLPTISDRIYFESGSHRLDSQYYDAISAIAKLLTMNSELNLHIIGHSDYLGLLPQKQELAFQRATVVKAALIAKGIEPSRLRTSASLQPPPDVTSAQPLRLSRCVRFEVLAIDK